MFLGPGSCIPYSQNACEDASDRLGLQKGGETVTKKTCPDQGPWLGDSRNKEDLGGRIEGELFVHLSSDVLLLQDLRDVYLLDRFPHFIWLLLITSLILHITDKSNI